MQSNSVPSYITGCHLHLQVTDFSCTRSSFQGSSLLKQQHTTTYKFTVICKSRSPVSFYNIFEINVTCRSDVRYILV